MPDDPEKPGSTVLSAPPDQLGAAAQLSAGHDPCPNAILIEQRSHLRTSRSSHWLGHRVYDPKRPLLLVALAF